ncbi:uncharacterized protein [Clytia hemisphaerica]|uniref:uncharacterized protein n=1 Tax=Clytia hemisphaerica TaxID=252671 RepID=UPI0034D5BC92
MDMIPRFGRPVPQLSIISNKTMDIIYNNWSHLLTSFNQNWLSPANLQRYADAVHEAGGPLTTCWGFIDGTVRPICKPTRNQRTVYNGHKKIHSLKFQSVATPNGLCANLFGPIEGRRHDSYMLAQSRLYPLLVQHSRNLNGDPLCIYGDPAYPLRPQLQCPFKGVRITPLQRQWNLAMSSVRVSVEWIFNDIINYFKFIDFRKNLKLGLSAVGKMYIVCVLMQNARSCLYGSITSKFFKIDPPRITEYFT